MSPPVSRQVSFDELRELNIRMDGQLSEIKSLLSDINNKQREMELREAGCSPLMSGKLDAAWRRIDDHDARIKMIEAELPIKANREVVADELKVINETLIEIKQTNKILTWLGGLMTTTIIVYLLNQFLHLL